MINLLKFELLRKKNTYGILIFLFLLYEGFQLYKWHSIGSVAGLVGALPLFILASVIFFLVNFVKDYSHILNSNNEHMVFMVPLSGFKIMFTKFLASFIVLLSLGIFIGLLTLVNLTILKIVDSSNLFQFYTNDSHIVLLPFFLLGLFMNFLALIYLSMTFTKAFLSRVPFRSIIIIVVMVVISKIYHRVFAIFINMDSLHVINSLSSYIFSILVTIVISISMIWITGWLIDTKIDF